jgi:FkbM family methyltransferase
VPATFSLLSKTLAGFTQVELLDVAISDEEGFLKLYMSTERNVTSSSKLLVTSTGHAVSEELKVKACTLAEMTEEYPISMIRMDVEGHEYAILARDIPKQIKAISVELHVLPPYEKRQALELLQNLRNQGFRVSVVVNEMGYGYYHIVQLVGLKNAHKLATSTLTQARSCPSILRNPSLSELVDRVPEKGQIHLLLQR